MADNLAMRKRSPRESTSAELGDALAILGVYICYLGSFGGMMAISEFICYLFSPMKPGSKPIYFQRRKKP